MPHMPRFRFVVVLIGRKCVTIDGAYNACCSHAPILSSPLFLRYVLLHFVCTFSMHPRVLCAHFFMSACIFVGARGFKKEGGGSPFGMCPRFYFKNITGTHARSSPTPNWDQFPSVRKMVDPRLFVQKVTPYKKFSQISPRTPFHGV